MDRSEKAGISGALAMSALTIGVAAFGSFLSSRHRGRGIGDGPDYALRKPPGKLELVGRTVTIRKPREELFAFWRDFSNLSGFMENLDAVVPGSAPDRHVWKIRAPLGQIVDVETRVVDEIAGKRIGWRSVEDSDIHTSGEVRFEDAPGERGTRVTLIVAYAPPGGTIGAKAAKLFLREPEVQARHDLKRFKMLMETGEIATSARTNDMTRAAKQENG